MAEWRHGLLVAVPASLAEALASLTRCEERGWLTRLCLEEAAIETLALALEERNAGWRRDGLRARALLELADRYLGWILAGEEKEPGLVEELLRRAYDSAAAAFYDPSSGLRGDRRLRDALLAAREALERGSLEEMVRAAAVLAGAVRAACPHGCGEAHLAPRRVKAYVPAASALPP